MTTITAVLASANHSSGGGPWRSRIQATTIMTATTRIRTTVTVRISVRGWAGSQDGGMPTRPSMSLSRAGSGTRVDPARGATWAT